AAGELIGALDAEAGKLRPEGSVQQAHQLTYTAEVLRARHAPAGAPSGLTEQAAVWEQAAAAWELAREPYPMATALFRAAEAALASGGAKEAAAPSRPRGAGSSGGSRARPPCRGASPSSPPVPSPTPA